MLGTVCVALTKRISSENVTSVLSLEAPLTEPEKSSGDSAKTQQADSPKGHELSSPSFPGSVSLSVWCSSTLKVKTAETSETSVRIHIPEDGALRCQLKKLHIMKLYISVVGFFNDDFCS